MNHDARTTGSHWATGSDSCGNPSGTSDRGKKGRTYTTTELARIHEAVQPTTGRGTMERDLKDGAIMAPIRHGVKACRKPGRAVR